MELYWLTAMIIPSQEKLKLDGFYLDVRWDACIRTLLLNTYH